MDPRAKASDQAAAIEFAATAGAKVIALGGYVNPTDKAVAAAIRNAGARDIVVVTVPGGGSASPSLAPAASLATHVLRVGSIGIDGKPAKTYPAGTVDVVAPGIAVAGLGISGVGQVEVTGAQYAVAFAAGEVALIRARYPQLTAAEVVLQVKATADPLGGSTNGRFGAGLIDPGQAVNRPPVAETRSPVPQPVAAPPAKPRPYRVDALVIIAVLALGTTILLILRARSMIRPDAPTLGRPATAAANPGGPGTAVGLRVRRSRHSTSEAGSAAPTPERLPATVPVAPVAVPDETPVTVSDGASRTGSGPPVGDRHLARRAGGGPRQ
jgi:hypothetical protein